MISGTRILLRNKAVRKYVPSDVNFTPTASPSLMNPENFRKLSNRDLSLFIYSPSSSIESLRHITLPVLQKELEVRREFLTHKDIYRIVSGLASKNVILNTDILSTLQTAVEIHSTQFGAHELSYMIVELAACVRRLSENGHKIFRMLSLFCEEFGRKIFAATVVDLSNVIVGIADCGFQPSADLIERIALSVLIQIGTCRGPELTDLLSGFALMGVKNDDLLRASYSHIADRIHRLWTPQIVDLLFVMARFGYPSDLPVTIKEKLEASVCEQLEQRQDHLDMKFADLLISSTMLNLIDRIPKTRNLIRSYLVRQKRHDWWLKVPSIQRLIEAVQRSNLCIIGRDIDYIPAADLKNEDEILGMLEYLSNVLETEFIRQVDIDYGKALIVRLAGHCGASLSKDTRLADLPRVIYPMSDVYECGKEETVVQNDPTRSDLKHVVELNHVINNLIRNQTDVDVTSACIVNETVLDSLITRAGRRFGVMLIPDNGYHVFQDNLSRELKPRIRRQIKRLEESGIVPIVIDGQDWRNCDRVDLVRNSLEQFI
jgi:hypothetical protein